MAYGDIKSLFNDRDLLAAAISHSDNISEALRYLGVKCNGYSNRLIRQACKEFDLELPVYNHPLKEDACIGTLHNWLNKHYPRAGRCENCNECKKTEYAIKTGRSYSRNRYDYRELCHPCHVKYDAHIHGSEETRRKKSEGMKGRNFSQEHRAKLSRASLGNTYWKLNLRDKSGKFVSPKNNN